MAPDIKLGDWLEMRRQLMEAGRSSSEAPLVNFDLAGPKNDKPGYYDWDYNNFAPRVAVAWTPQADSGLFGWLTGNGKMADSRRLLDRLRPHRHGAGEQLRQGGLVRHGDQPVEPLRRAQRGRPVGPLPGASTWIPSTLPEAPPGGFPQTPPSYAGVITSALDGTITTPYSHAFNVVVGRELGRGFSFEAAYVGRRGRNLLVRRDAAMPANLTDPASGQDYFTAVGQLIRLRAGHRRQRAAVGLCRHSEPARTGRTCSPARPAAA